MSMSDVYLPVRVKHQLTLKPPKLTQQPTNSSQQPPVHPAATQAQFAAHLSLHCSQRKQPVATVNLLLEGGSVEQHLTTDTCRTFAHLAQLAHRFLQARVILPQPKKFQFLSVTSTLISLLMQQKHWWCQCCRCYILFLLLHTHRNLNRKRRVERHARTGLYTHPTATG